MRPAYQEPERGSVLVVFLILFIAIGGIASATLTMVTSEEKKNTARLNGLQAQLLADADLAIARNIINASAYDSRMRNAKLHAALASKDRLIEGTNVEVEQIGTSPNFILRSVAIHRGTRRTSEAIVRESSPVSQFNLYVIDHPVGISGEPRGAIHSNKTIDFFFPDGNYRDAVTASEGFQYVAGASPENTRLTGVANPSAPPQDILANIDFDSLWAEADVLSITDPELVSEVEFRGANAEVRLYRKAHEVEETVTLTREQIARYETETYTEPEPVYHDVDYTELEWIYVDEDYTVTRTRNIYAWRDETRRVRRPIYEKREVTYTVEVPVMATRTIQVTEEELVWVSFDGSGGASASGGTVGAAGSAEGYWTRQNVTGDVQEEYVSHYVTEDRTRTERVRVGTREFDKTYRKRYVERVEEYQVERTRKVPSHQVEVTRTRREIKEWRDVTKTREVPIYETVEEEVTRTRQVAETLERTETISTEGVAFFAGDVRRLSGTVGGRLSMIVGGEVSITGSLQYVDPDGNTRMLNGTDRTKPYEENPVYQGDALLAVLANKDIRYSKDVPSQLEINASLISAEGSVSFEGIEVSDDGKDVMRSSGDTSVRESIRRLGGIVSRERPVATYIDEFGFVGAGFEFGESRMDQNLILSSGTSATPPFMFEAPKPTWILQTRGRRLGVTP